ncbi:leucine-rich repeat protein [Tanacetum coccineum]
MNSPKAIICLSPFSGISFLFYGLVIICLTSATVSASDGGNETDYHALLSFKSKITHDPNKVLTSWNHSFHFCSLSPHVGNLSFLRNLFLLNNSFQGPIPHELGRLSRLRYLYLYDNKFSGVIPTNLSRCSNLEVLSLGRNKLAGSIPKEMSLLSKLVGLWIDNNKLTGGIPPFLGNITSMEYSSQGTRGGAFPRYLWVFGKKLDVIFTLVACNYMKNCTRLIDLVLVNCNLIGVLPTSIGNLSDQLNHLFLGDNQLFGSLPSSIGLSLMPNGNLSLLNILYLNSNKLEGHIPSSLGKCKELTVLSLPDNRLSGKIPKQILQLPSLTIALDLSQNSLSGSVPSEIKDLKMLSYLDLSHNNLSGTITSSLGECISLTELYLSGNIFQGIIPSSIRSLRGLEVLDMSQNNLSGKIPQFFDKRFSLEFLNLSFNDFEGEVPVVGVFANASAFSVLGTISSVKKRSSPPSQSVGNERFLKVSYNELLKATNGFSTENLIGEGGFSSVYKGILDYDDDKFVAVKVLHLQNRGAHKSNDFKALVYEFMPNGSVHDWLHSRAYTSKLNLLQRINILKDVATALDYLHNRCQTTIVHEYGIGSEMTTSGDVYSFGILLLEVMTGKKPIDGMFNEGLSLHKFAYMALPDHVIDVIDNDAIVLQSTKANTKKVEECLIATIKIGVSCSLDSPPQRMKIEIVVIELQRILDVNTKLAL